jgi:hypothetical protein
VRIRRPTAENLFELNVAPNVNPLAKLMQERCARPASQTTMPPTISQTTNPNHSNRIVPDMLHTTAALVDRSQPLVLKQ